MLSSALHRLDLDTRAWIAVGAGTVVAAVVAAGLVLWLAPAGTATDRGSTWAAALIAALIVMVSGACAALIMEAALARDSAQPPSAPTPGYDPRPAQVAYQRAEMIRAVANLMGQLPEQFAWQANRALQAGGARPLVPDGQRFDPARHSIVGTVPADGKNNADVIARTLRPGYEDDDEVFVPARVLVYTAEADRSDPPR